MESKKTVLIIDTHLTYPNWTEGKLNASFVQVAKDYFLSKGFDVLETKVEKGYQPEEEVEKHLRAHIIILQTPVNWFGAPWIYKKYVDEVFNSGLFSKKLLIDDGRTKEDPSKQYGSGGNLQGKQFMICATWNAPQEAFNNPDQKLFKGKSTSDLFLHITSNYVFCGCDVVPDYNSFDIFKNGDVVKDLENYPKHLAKVFNLKQELTQK